MLLDFSEVSLTSFSVKEFNLVYWEKENPDKKVLGKKVMSGHYCLLDPETGIKERITVGALKKRYMPDKNNHLAGKNASMETMGRLRGIKADSKKFQQYLDGKY